MRTIFNFFILFSLFFTMNLYAQETGHHIVIQNGTDLEADFVQYPDNFLLIEQQGQHLDATIIQETNGSEAELIQEGSYLKGTIEQQSGVSDVSVAQTGTNNEAIARQYGYQNELFIQQAGKNNELSIYSGGLSRSAGAEQAEGSIGAKAVLIQIGTGVYRSHPYSSIHSYQGPGKGNEVYLNQFASESNLDASQEGDYNYTDQDQNGFRVFSRVNQQGSYNRTTVEQSGSYQDNWSTQTGDNNQLDLKQQGRSHNLYGGNSTRIHQNGNDNIIDIDLSEGNLVQINQDGSSNETTINSANTGYWIDYQISLDLDQSGDFNQVEIYQEGNSILNINQAGRYHTGRIRQSH